MVISIDNESEGESFGKHFWKKEKMLVTSNHNIAGKKGENAGNQ